MEIKAGKISYKRICSFFIEIFRKVGLDSEDAQITAEAICNASLEGTDSHGIRLLPHYIEAIEAGRIDVNAQRTFKQTSPSTGILDANHGIAHAAVAKAMDFATELAEDAGTGFVSVKNSNHCGAMGYYGKRACGKDMIGVAFTNATPKLQVFNSTNPYFGINPLCLTAPMAGEDPFCYDAAPSVMSNNKIKLLAEKGEKLHENVAVDKTGEMTKDPHRARMLFPLGGPVAGYKGYAMAMMGDILCSLLSGMPNGKDVSPMYEKDGGNISDKRYLGQFVGAIKIDVFEEAEEFKRRLKKSADEIRELPKKNDAKEEVMVPGDPEKQTKEKRLKMGIPVADELNKKFDLLAEKYDLDF